jgi:hypothetical protein
MARLYVSRKGCADTFAILNDHTVAYMDLYGSGASPAPSATRSAGGLGQVVGYLIRRRVQG